MATLIWHVDDDVEFCSLAAEIAERIGLAVTRLAPDEAARRHGGPLPDAVIVDGEPFRTSSIPGRVRTGEPPHYIQRADRVLVCTAYLDEDLDVDRIRDARIRLLRKPFDLDEFEVALAWLEGDAQETRRVAAELAAETRQLVVGRPWSTPRVSAAPAE